LPVPEIFSFQTVDNLTLRLTRFSHKLDGAGKGPLLLVHGMGVSSRMFLVDTIQVSLAEFLYKEGFDIWLIDNRVSVDLPYAASLPNLDLVVNDYLPAVDKILEVTGSKDVLVFCHCLGAMTFFMSMCTGKLAGKIRSIVTSGVALHTIPGWYKKLQAELRFPDFLRNFKSSVDPTIEKGFFNNVAGWSLSTGPIPTEEECASHVCHRMTFVYGLLYIHDQLNTLTHNTQNEQFGVASIDALSHVAAMVRHGHCVDVAGKDIYLPNAAENLKLPIFFITGEKNPLWNPESVQLTLKFLAEQNGPELYSSNILPGHGHIDNIYGKNAANDVYPHIVNFFNAHL